MGIDFNAEIAKSEDQIKVTRILIDAGVEHCLQEQEKIRASNEALIQRAHGGIGALNWLKLLFPYRAHLEAELKQQRDDFTVRLTEKDTLIRALRLELAQVKVENERMRLVLTPVGSTAGQMYAAKFQPAPQHEVFEAPQDWHADLSKMLKEEEDGIRSGRRIQEHQPGADDGA